MVGGRNYLCVAQITRDALLKIKLIKFIIIKSLYTARSKQQHKIRATLGVCNLQVFFGWVIQLTWLLIVVW